MGDSLWRLVQEVRFPSGDLKLYGEFHEASGKPKGGIVLVHGFNSRIEEFGKAPWWLAEAGYSTLAFDQSGFGNSEGEIGRTDLPRAQRDIQAATEELRNRIGANLPLFIVGHSLGGAYVASVLGVNTPYRAAVLAQPLDTLFAEMHPPARLFYHLAGRRAERRMAKGQPAGRVPYKSHSKRLFVSKEAQLEAGRPDFLLRHVYLANYRGAHDIHGSAFARSVTVPTMVVVSPHDLVVKPAHSMRVFEALPEPKALFQQKGGHSCFRDLDGRAIVNACVTWFDKHLEAQA